MPSQLFTDATPTVPGTLVTAGWINPVDSAAYNTLASVAGTNAITATGPLSYTAYTTGSRFFFIPALANTGAVTINISGLGVRSVTKFGATALVAGDLPVARVAEIYYDGTQFQLLNPRNVDVSTVTGTLPIANGGTGSTTGPAALVALGAVGRLLNVVLFSAGSGTYTPTAGTTRVLVEIWGGGGAGGGALATAAGQISLGGGGGAGGYVSSFLTTGFSGAGYAVGAAGAGVSGAPGTSGGSTTFGAMTAGGGTGGGVSSASPTTAIGTAAGGTATGGNLLNLGGASPSEASAIFTPTNGTTGTGAASQVGRGGYGQFVGSGSVGIAAAGYASGGGGARSYNGTGAQTGGAGTSGLIRIYEYS